MLAEIMLRNGDPQRGSALLERNLEEDAIDAISLRLLAQCHLNQGKPTHAIHDLDQAMDSMLNGGDADLWFLMSMACYRGDRTKGRDWYDKANRWMEANAPRDPRLVRLRTAVIESAN